MKPFLRIALPCLAATLQLNAGVVLSENFDNVSGLLATGWLIVNDSDSIGSTTWEQGKPADFASHAGAPDSYAWVDYNAGGDYTDIYLMTPEIFLTNGLVISFFTRTYENPAQYADSLYLYMSSNGASTTLSDFWSNELLVVNPDLNATDYPADWTLYSVTISGLAGPTTGRLAFDYYVDDNDANGNTIGIDTLSVTGDTPEPVSFALAGVGLGVLALVRARKQAKA